MIQRLVSEFKKYPGVASKERVVRCGRNVILPVLFVSLFPSFHPPGGLVKKNKSIYPFIALTLLHIIEKKKNEAKRSCEMIEKNIPSKAHLRKLGAISQFDHVFRTIRSLSQRAGAKASTPSAASPGFCSTSIRQDKKRGPPFWTTTTIIFLPYIRIALRKLFLFFFLKRAHTLFGIFGKEKQQKKKKKKKAPYFLRLSSRSLDVCYLPAVRGTAVNYARGGATVVPGKGEDFLFLASEVFFFFFLASRKANMFCFWPPGRQNILCFGPLGMQTCFVLGLPEGKTFLAEGASQLRNYGTTFYFLLFFFLLFFFYFILRRTRKK